MGTRGDIADWDAFGAGNTYAGGLEHPYTLSGLGDCDPTYQSCPEGSPDTGITLPYYESTHDPRPTGSSAIKITREGESILSGSFLGLPKILWVAVAGLVLWKMSKAS